MKAGIRMHNPASQSKTFLSKVAENPFFTRKKHPKEKNSRSAGMSAALQASRAQLWIIDQQLGDVVHCLSESKCPGQSTSCHHLVRHIMLYHAISCHHHTTSKTHQNIGKTTHHPSSLTSKFCAPLERCGT